ncbi:flagellin [Virgibacillus subterraneus]|uniref:Flagellin n=2 Tax=Virgibacillus TaxID=84406 RepID=A0A1H0Z9K5_9BACI|nr:flagellin [Virgibacillus salinus]SEP89377.1 flagellin [Virgibacillus subterraneus]
MNESHSILQRMRELAVQSANDTNTDTDRAEMQKEVDQLAGALTDISQDTEFNTKNLLDGSFEGTFHVGANEGQNLTLEIGDMSAEALEVQGETEGTGIDVSTEEAADAAITTIQEAIDSVSGERSKLGAVQNRLDHTINNLGTSAENLTAAESRIRDVDMAKEMMNFTKNNILSQAAQSMLAQANQQPQGVLQLLR